MIKKFYTLSLLLTPALLLAVPVTPTILHLEPLSAHSVNITWETSDDSYKGYKIFRDGELIKRISDSSIKNFEDTGLSPHTDYVYEVKATDDETPATIEAIVARHNVYRNLDFSDSNLTWDEELANHAQTWAQYLATHYTQAEANNGSIPHASHFQTDQHNEDDYAEGENIALSNPAMPYVLANPVDISDVAIADAFPFAAVDAWASEKAYYDYTTNAKKQGYERKAIGHYTQLIWQKTTKVGCGRAVSTTDYAMDWVVCRYAVSGNLTFNGVKQKPYCSNYTVSDLYTDVSGGFTPAMIAGKSFDITKVVEDRAACKREDRPDSVLSFTGVTSASIPQYDVFNEGESPDLWEMNFDDISIDAEGVLTMRKVAGGDGSRYMRLKLIGETATHYSVEAYWWIIKTDYSGKAILKLKKELGDM